MRPLTQQEIDDAPEWATHYCTCEDGDVLLENSEFFIFTSKPNKKLGQLFGVDSDSKPIPRKEFDISDHDFGVDVRLCSLMSVEFFTRKTNLLVTKEDSIALAKHFKLTAEDLK